MIMTDQDHDDLLVIKGLVMNVFHTDVADVY